MHEHILAKSNPQLSLKQHIDDGLTVWRQLQVLFPVAPQMTGKPNIWELLRLAIIMHDTGKGHSEFQKVLRGNDNNNWKRQRHELFSLGFCNALQIDEGDKQLIIRVVAGHHKSYTKLREFIEPNYKVETGDFEKEFGQLDITAILALITSYENVQLGEVQPLHPKEIISSYLKEKRRDDIQDYFTLLLMVGAFKQCDHLSSAFVTELGILKPVNFLFLEKKQKTLQEQNKDLYAHQKEAAQTLGSVILTAPTGSGKTETAILWLKHQMELKGQGRTFYVLPFTASINAMFERLRNEEKGMGEQAVGMIHGKLDAYLYDVFQECGRLEDQKALIKEVKEQFKTLQTPLKVLTPFQLLKNIFGLSGFEKGIFEWVGGYFIFDEIHAYEPEVIAQIVVLLKYITRKLDANVFIMTATLPTFLREILQQAIGEHSTIFAEPRLYDTFKRHRVLLKAGLLADNLNMIKADLADGKKVLVVCNTVLQAQEVYKALNEENHRLLIHGSYSAKDRTEIEKQLHKQPPRLLIGTQAIEVSLDIDYDVIYTEPAPLDAIIQRFGRVNRERKKEPCPCYVFTQRNKKDAYIYSDSIIQRTLAVLNDISTKSDGIIQEIELQNYIDQVYPGFIDEELTKFNSVSVNLSNTADRLAPFEPSAEGEEAYYRQFDGVKVVPLYYEKQYKNLINKYDFIGAEQLKVQIRKGRFAQYYGKPDMQKELISLPILDGAKFIEISYYLLKKKYRRDLGLIIDEDEDSEELLSNFEGFL
jgi:CRISPR-associated endonuclease/helicase Cas3